MLDNLTLPPPPTAGGTPVYYRYSFYNIPFSREGEDVALPTAAIESNIAEELRSKNYLQYEVITNRAFRSEQESIVIPQSTQFNDIAYNVNYCRVAAVRDGQTELYDYTYDLNANYYWIDNAEFLSVMDGFIDGAIQFSISKDYVMTHFMVNRGNELSVRGILNITNDFSHYKDYGATSLANANFDNKVTVQKVLSQNISYALLICYTSQVGELRTVIIDCDDTPYAAASSYVGNLTSAAWIASCVYKEIAEAKTNDVTLDYGNVSIKKIYALPLEWVVNFKFENPLQQDYFVFKRPNASDEKVKIYTLHAMVNQNEAVYSFSKGVEVFSKHIWEKWFLKTPSRLIELKGNPLNSTFFDFSIYLDLAPAGASDTINIRMLVNNEYVDISEVFNIDFAVNEKALQQSQFKELTVLEGVSAAVGAIGGVVGGISSGNYFGAVQAAIGGGERIGNILTAEKNTAQLRSNGSFLNGLEQYGIFAFLGFVDAKNNQELNKINELYGCAFSNKIYINLTFDPIEEKEFYNKFYQLSNVNLFNIPRKGSYAEMVIKERFEQGIRFREL